MCERPPFFFTNIDHMCSNWRTSMHQLYSTFFSKHFYIVCCSWFYVQILQKLQIVPRKSEELFVRLHILEKSFSNNPLQTRLWCFIVVLSFWNRVGEILRRFWTLCQMTLYVVLHWICAKVNFLVILYAKCFFPTISRELVEWGLPCREHARNDSNLSDIVTINDWSIWKLL